MDVYHEYGMAPFQHREDLDITLRILKEKYPEFQKKVSTHTFRYTHISLLAEAGLPIKAIMDRVGHSDMKTTLEIYNQVTSSMKEKIIQEVDSWIF